MKNDIDQPLITIGITCYNACNTVARAIKSAVNQSWDNIEIIIVDDCSSDNSIEKINEIAGDYPNITLISHSKNKGVAGARQTIIDNAKGEFIAFFDDDDESHANRCLEQYKHIISYEKNNNVELLACYASGKRIYENGYEIDLCAIGSQGVVPKGNDMANYLLFYGKRSNVFYGAGTPTCSLMVRKIVFEKVGGFDINFRRVEDIDFAIRLSLAGGHFIGCSEVLFTQYSTEAGDKTPAKNLESELQLAEKYKDYLKSINRYEYAKRWPLIRYYHFIGNHRRMLLALWALFIRNPVKTATHFFQTAPRRFIHEIRMKKTKKDSA